MGVVEERGSLAHWSVVSGQAVVVGLEEVGAEG